MLNSAFHFDQLGASCSDFLLSYFCFWWLRCLYLYIPWMLNSAFHFDQLGASCSDFLLCYFCFWWLRCLYLYIPWMLNSAFHFDRLGASCSDFQLSSFAVSVQVFGTCPFKSNTFLRTSILIFRSCLYLQLTFALSRIQHFLLSLASRIGHLFIA